MQLDLSKNFRRCIKCNAEEDNQDKNIILCDQTQKSCINIVQVVIAQI